MKTLIQSIRDVINGRIHDNEIIVPIEDRSVSTSNDGKKNVSTEVFDLVTGLRNNLVLGKAGATIITGQQANLNIPKLNTGNTANWRGETEIATDSSIEFDDVLYSPYRLTSYLTLSNEWLLQDSTGANNVLLQDLINSICEKIEQTVLGNTDGIDHPEGMFYGYDDITPISYQEIVDMEEELDNLNVQNFNRSFIVHPTAKSKLRNTFVEKGSGRSIFERGKVLSIPTEVTNNIVEDGVLYGDFSNLVIVIFDPILITIDPFTLALEGKTIITINCFVDCKPRREECFVKRIIAEGKSTDTVTVDMMDQWGKSTYAGADLDGYTVYQSRSNYNVSNGRAKVRLSFKDLTEFKFKYRSDGESNYDYVIVSKLDTELGSSDIAGSATVLYYTQGKQEQWFDASYECDEGEHFVEIVYRKDSGGDQLQDSGFIAISNDYAIIELNAVKPPEPIIMKGKFTDGSASSDWWYYKDGSTSSSKKVDITEFVDPDTKEFEVQIGETSKLKTLAYLFYNNKKIERFDEISDTTGITDMSYMFSGCSALQSLDLTGWNTESVTDMPLMFNGCSALKEIKGLDCWDTSKVTTMRGMFSGCSSLQSLDLTGWNTESVTSMFLMFSGCSALQSLDLTGWNTESVTDMSSMFSNCSALQTITGLGNCITSKVTSMNSMFNGCSSLQSIDGIESWNTSKVTDMYMMLKNCSSLKEIIGLDWITDEVTNMHQMFNGCSSLQTITGLENCITSKVTDMSLMFNGCSALKEIKGLDCWDTSKVTTMRGMFSGCSSLQSIDGIESWNTSKVTTMNEMFYKCSSLQEINGLDWITDEVTDMSSMFSGCSALQTITGLENCITSKLTNMSSMFSSCSALQEINGIYGWDTSKVTSMNNLFNNCSSLQELDVSTFKTPKVTEMSGIFANCSSLQTIKGLENWDVENVTNMGGLFYNCPSIAKINGIENWNTQNNEYLVIKYSYFGMFENCSSIDTLDLTGWSTDKVLTYYYVFGKCTSLKTLIINFNFVEGSIGLSGGSTIFDSTRNIENIITTGGLKICETFSLANCSKLTNESVMVIINALEDRSEKSTKTLTLYRTQYDELTTDQIAVATSKGWSISRI